MARPAAEIEPQLSIFSSNRILPGPIFPSGSRLIRTLREGNDVGDDLRMVCWFISKDQPARSDPPVSSQLASIATAWIDLNVLSRGILIVATALRQIVARTCGCLRSRDRPDGAAGDSAHRGSDRPTGDQPAQHATDDRAADGACARIRWRRRGGRIDRHRRRRIARARTVHHAIVGTGNVVHDLNVRNVGRGTLHRLRIEVPDAADIPPPAHTAIVHFVAPLSAAPGQTAVVGVTAEIALWKIAVHDAGTLRPLRSTHLSCAGRLPGGRGSRTCSGSNRARRGRRRRALPLLRFVLFLRLRRERKSSHDRYKRNGDPRAFEGTHGLISPLPREPPLWISCTSKSTLPAALELNANVMPLSRHKYQAIARLTGGRFALHRHVFVLQGAAFAL